MFESCSIEVIYHLLSGCFTDGGEGDAPSNAITRSNPRGDPSPVTLPSSRLTSDPLLTSQSDTLSWGWSMSRGLLLRVLFPRGLLTVVCLGLMTGGKKDRVDKNKRIRRKWRV